jgi:hypothetical protein
LGIDIASFKLPEYFFRDRILAPFVVAIGKTTYLDDYTFHRLLERRIAETSTADDAKKTLRRLDFAKRFL